jgi:hypothetical protein
MQNTVWRRSRSFAAGVLLPLMAATGTLSAASHVVSPSELARAASEATSTRQQNEAALSRFLSSPQASDAFAKAGMDSRRVASAVAQLSDEDMAKLAARAEAVQTDFAAGDLTQRDLLWIIVGIAALILIIVAVR